MRQLLKYLFLLAITISSVTPNHGKAGDSVTITGTDFPDNVQVSFSGWKCLVTEKSETTLKCTVPRGFKTVEVRIITPTSHSAFIKNGFTYDK